MEKQATIDHYSEKIQMVIQEAIENKDTLLPYSITRPAMIGKRYDSKEILKGYFGIKDGPNNFKTAKDAYDDAMKAFVEGTMDDTRRKKTSSKGAKEDKNRSKSPLRKETATSPMKPKANRNNKAQSEQKGDIPSNRKHYSPQKDNKFDMNMITSARKIEKMKPQQAHAEKMSSKEASSSNNDTATQRADVDALLHRTENFGAFSLVIFAERKIEQLGPQIQSVQPKMIFPNSSILNELEAQTLYYVLPFFTKAPVCSLIFSSENHKRGLDEVYKRCAHSRTPCVMVVKSGNFVFGAYLSHPLHLTGVWSGSPSCFIFSSTLGLKFSYHGRYTPEKYFEDGTLGPAAFFADLDQLLIGNGDIALNTDLTIGSSNLENCYGIGLDRDGNDAKVLLAGAPNFRVDTIEVWGIA